MQEAMLAEGEVVEEASPLDKIAAFERSCPRFRNLLEFGSPCAATSTYTAMLAFDHLNGKSGEVQFLPAAFGAQLFFFHASGKSNFRSRSGPDCLRAVFFRNEGNVADVVNVAM